MSTMYRSAKTKDEWALLNAVVVKDPIALANLLQKGVCENVRVCLGKRKKKRERKGKEKIEERNSMKLS